MSEIFLVGGVLTHLPNMRDKHVVYQYYIARKCDEYIEDLGMPDSQKETLESLKKELAERHLLSDVDSECEKIYELEGRKLALPDGETIMVYATIQDLWDGFNYALGRDDDDAALAIITYLQYRGGEEGVVTGTD